MIRNFFVDVVVTVVIVFLVSLLQSVSGGDCDLVIHGFTLVNATTKRTISSLQDFDKVSPNASSYAILANPGSCKNVNNRTSPVRSVYVGFDTFTFGLRSQFVHCETYAPYTIFTDPSMMDVPRSSAKYYGYSIPIGQHSVFAVPFNDEKCKGIAGPIMKQEFFVRDPEKPPLTLPVCTKRVTTNALCRFNITIRNNIINDPSFEEYTSCPIERNQINQSKYWVSGKDTSLPDYWVGGPICSNDTKWRTLSRHGYDPVVGRTINYNASNGNAFIGSYVQYSTNRHPFIGQCLNKPLKRGIEYELQIDIATTGGNGFGRGGAVNAIELYCVTNCTEFPIPAYRVDFLNYELLGQNQPKLELYNNAPFWSTSTINFIPRKSDCNAIMFGSYPTGGRINKPTIFYLLYDNIQLREVIRGVCNRDGQCIAAADPIK